MAIREPCLEEDGFVQDTMQGFLRSIQAVRNVIEAELAFFYHNTETALRKMPPIPRPPSSGNHAESIRVPSENRSLRRAVDAKSSDRLHPVMSEAEIDCYLQHLSQASAVLEYGAGGSTVLAAEHGVKSLYSLDTDAAWLAKAAAQRAVSKMIAAGNARLVHVDLGPVGKWGKPKVSRYIHRWPIYARRPWRDGFRPDLVLVDGRFRVSCVMQCLLHGGPDLKIAIHDFWKRPFYRGVLPFVTVLDRVDTLAVLKANGNDTWFATLPRLRHAFDRR